MAVFLTGATGFLGTEVAAGLIRSTEEKIFVPVRAENTEAAVHRLKAFWYDMPELYSTIGVRILPLTGDFTKPELGLDPEKAGQLKGEITRIFHIGAETGIQKSRKELLSVNRKGTEQVLHFAREIDVNGSLERFVYLSTAYTAGMRSGTILEEDLPPDRFANYYEQSKAMAEKLVRDSKLPFTICRPGMIVGHSKTGRIRNFNTVYYVLKLMLQGKLRTVPVSAEQKINLVPVDYVAESTVRLSYMPEAEGRCCSACRAGVRRFLIMMFPPWIKETTGEEMRARILQIRAGLEALGMRKGDKVAITGSNCTDYFALHIAIRLCGGITVPIYYTTPAAEIDLLLSRSGARWFFVGDRRIMEQVDQLESKVPVIAFFSALEVTPGQREFMTWNSFLSGGASPEVPRAGDRDPQCLRADGSAADYHQSYGR